MKLDYKKVILVGFAFFIISAFWQAYDKVVPLILTNKFNMSQTKSGIIMALDNVLAVFLLPLFGSLSDKTNSRFGRRTPFIVLGTIASVCIFLFLPLIGNVYVFIAVLLAVLLSMATYRSPAVALMPDVTVKPHRSKANAIINLMGTAGGILVLGLGIIFSKTNKTGHYFPYFLAVAGLMLIGLIVFILTVKEKQWANQMLSDTKLYYHEEEKVDIKEEKDELNDKKSVSNANNKLSKSQFLSLILILASVALWFMGYNAITSKYSVYAETVLDKSYDLTLIIAQIAAIISYIPVGIIASKFGRKRTILIGVALLALSFGTASFIKSSSPDFIIYLLFSLAGIAWATINVNSFPMVVELSKFGDIGKYTGFYYTASMSAQIFTPIFSGFLVDNLGWWVFFPYAALCVALAFITMFFVKHGDSRPEKTSALEALAGADD